jgi:hypothetical protein
MGRVFFNTRENVHELNTATYQVLASDSGKTFLLDSAAEMDITLPAEADISEGWNARFVIKTANADVGYKIHCTDKTDTTGQMFDGALSVIMTTSGASSTNQAVLAATNDSLITLDSDLPNNGATKGTFIDIFKSEANKFFVTGVVVSTDDDGTGAAIFSNA